jgi:hypothetical protein
MLSTFPASSASGPGIQNLLGNDTNEDDSISLTNETKLMKQEIELSFHFLKSMLQMLDLSFNLMNETLNTHVEEYPFLESTANGTNAGIKTVDSIISVLQTDPENLSDVQTKLIALNETVAQFNTSSEYSGQMIEAANSTLGEENITGSMTGDMFKDVQKMISLFDQL